MAVLRVEVIPTMIFSSAIAELEKDRQLGTIGPTMRLDVGGITNNANRFHRSWRYREFLLSSELSAIDLD